MDTVDIHRSPLRAVGLFLAACAFTAVCAWMAYAHPGTGRRAVTPGSFAEFAAYVGVMFFGLCAVLMVPKLFQRGPVVSVGASGIYRFDPTEMGEAAFRLAFPGWPPIDLGFEVRRARVQFLRGGRAVLASDKRADPEGLVAAFVMPAISADGSVVDLIAWRPRGNRIGSTERAAGWLAGGYLSDDEPLIVHPDPLAWLRAGRQGVVIVHEDLARPALLARRTLQAADVAHGEALEAKLAKVRLPQIVVPAFPHETPRRAA